MGGSGFSSVDPTSFYAFFEIWKGKLPVFRIRIQGSSGSGSGSGSRGVFKMLNNHNTILLFSDFYNILSFTIDFFPNLDFWLDPDSMNMDTKHWTLLKIKDDG